jgi:hypothetical protein
VANNPLPYDVMEIAAVAARAALLNSGTLKLYTGSQPALDGSVTGTLLVTLTFGATAFGTPTASSGVVTAVANAITSGTAVATGTPGYFVLEESGGTVLLTGTYGTSGCDLNGSASTIVSGSTVSCSSFVITQPQG